MEKEKNYCKIVPCFEIKLLMKIDTHGRNSKI